MNTREYIEIINRKYAELTLEEVLSDVLSEFGGRIALSSSLSIEDQALTDMLLRLKPDTNIFTLDTGRLFPETYSLVDKTNMRYGIKMRVFFPRAEEVQEMVCRDGMNLFYDGIDKRRECCRVRKIEPLKRAFEGLDAWICGLRREQSVTRADMRFAEWDEGNSLIKFNPLIDWSEDQVWDYVKSNGVPYNTLHEKGYPSIGCQPCTRAVEPGQDIRSGRWWWESPEHKECGLHKR